MSINVKNAHPRDALIQFEAGPHKYTCAGEANYTSVTTWNHSHFKEFDSDAIITRMMSNPRSWLKSPYYGKTREEIKAGWDKNRDEAAQLGTEMHEAIERWYGGVPPPRPPFGENDGGLRPPHPPLGVSGCLDYYSHLPEMGGLGGLPPNFMRFVADHPDLKPYRAEWMIFDEDVRLAGSIDMVYEAPDGSLMIYDWKRCKEIKKTNSFGEFAQTECINHLPDTNFWHYALQLNTYKAIIEAKYGKTVSRLCLVGLHPNLPSYQLLPVPVLKDEMNALFSLRRSML